MSQVLVRIKKADYLRWISESLNDEADLRNEAAEAQRYGPCIRFIAHLTGYDADVLGNPDDRIPRSGHKISIDTDPPEVFEFELFGFGKLDRRPGEKQKMPVRQKIAIQQRKSILAQPRSKLDDDDVEEAYG